MPKRLLVLGAGGPYREAFFRAAARRDVRTILVDENPYNRYDRLADRSVLRAPNDPALPDALRSMLDGVDGVTSLSDRAARMVDEVSRQYGTPGPGPQAALASNDKAALRRLTNAALDPVPWAQVASPADLHRFGDTHTGPVVLKPIDGTASFGVVLAEHTTAAVDRLDYVLARSRRGLAIAEAYVPGPEYSFEVSVQHGKLVYFSVTEKTASAPHFVERQYLVEQDQSRYAALGTRAFVLGLIAALGIENAVLHVEARHSPDGWRLIEAATRPGGGMIVEITRIATGVDLYDHQISVALGEEPPTPATPDSAIAGVRFVLGTGVLQDIHSLVPVCHDLPAVVQVAPVLSIGSQLPRADANWWRAGYVLARAADRDTVVRQLRTAEERLTRALGLRDAEARSPASPAEPAGVHPAATPPLPAPSGPA